MKIIYVKSLFAFDLSFRFEVRTLFDFYFSYKKKLFFCLYSNKKFFVLLCPGLYKRLSLSGTTKIFGREVQNFVKNVFFGEKLLSINANFSSL